MKRVIVSDGLREEDIRPGSLFDNYIRLLSKDVRELASSVSCRLRVPCPGCGRSDSLPAFKKNEFSYEQCVECRSTFLNPRLDAKDQQEFLQRSSAERFWHQETQDTLGGAREASIVRPRATWVASATMAELGGANVVLDIRSRYGSFLERIAAAGVCQRVVSLDPVVDVEGPVEVSSLEGWDGPSADVVVLQEGLERETDVPGLVRRIASLLRPDGLFFATTTTWSGFDLQVLESRSRRILPPVQANFISIAGIRSLLLAFGFELIEMSTPGRLDVEIVKQAVEQDPSLELPTFVDELIRHRDADVHRALQELLQRSLLSSHVRFVARKSAFVGG